MNIACWSEENLQCFGGYDAVVAGDRTWRSTELHDHACRFAAALVARGMVPGDRVVLLQPNGGELVVTFTAVLRAGGIPVPLFAGTTAHEIARVLEQCTPFAIVAGGSISSATAEAAARVPVRLFAPSRVDAPAGWESFGAFVASSEGLIEPVSREPEHPALICYTSGTSGTPRGVVYTHGGLCARHPVVNRRPRRARPPAVVLAALPLGTMGATILTARLASMMTLVTHEGFEPRRFIDAVERYRVQAVTMVPSMAEALLALPDLPKRDVRSLRNVIIGGAHVAENLVARLGDVLPVPPVVSYGMTEAGGGITAAIWESRGNGTSPVSVGEGMAGVDVRICDERGRGLAPGEIGEIHVRTPWMSAGYYGQPEQTASLFHDGWLRTGDLGYVDASSRLYIVGRRKELIIQGGVNVHPSDVETVIRPCPGVAACTVIGVANRFLGEEVVACVVPSAGSRITGEQVAAWCDGRLDPRKTPARVLVLPELPLTAAGKVDTEALRRRVMTPDGAAATPLFVELQYTAPAARISRLRELIGDEVRRTLRAADEGSGAAGSVPPDCPFVEFGLESLQIVRLCHRIGAFLGRDVSPLLAFSHPTAGSLADRLAADLFGALDHARLPAHRNVPRPDGIAIVGLGCRLPGADGPARVWQLLDEGVDATGEIRRPGLRRSLSGSGGAAGSATTRAALLADPDGFDAAFFGLSRREAAIIDPQQRLLLEVTWEALEDAGWNPLSLGGTSTGVFIGLSGSDEAVVDGLGAAASMASGRICHFLDLHGPAAVIDTACSSSLFAIHSAVRSLRSGECEVVVAGGASLIGSPRSFIGLSRLGTLAPDGRSKPFDAQADGYGRGEGCVLFVLRPLADAEAHGDRVLAVIRGSAAVHDGRSTSLTAPNGQAQEQVIRRALEDAGIEPASVEYLEAHGTGTRLGDPIELSAAMAVLGHPSRRLVIGSIKSNVGHLEAAAGAAGLLKVVLALRHERIPPHLHLRQLNPLLETFASQFLIPTTAHPWPARRDRLRIAGVTSMGLSGTNVHLVVADTPSKDAPAVSMRAEPPRPRLLCISARTDAALDTQIRRYVDHLRSVTPAEFADCCFTSAVGRAPLARRAAVVAVTPAGARAELLAHLEGAPATVSQGRQRGSVRVAFLFTGHGTQHAGMGRTLYEHESLFRQAIQRCADILQPLVAQPLIAGLGIEGAVNSDVSPLQDVAFAQPAIVAFEWALAEVWKAWGVEPEYVAGHSLGECAAAAVAGILSIEDALTLAAARGRLLGTISGAGRMAAVRAPADDVERRLVAHAGRVAIAAINGPQNTVVSGSAVDIERAAASMIEDGIDVTWLAVPAASHSPMTDPILDEVERIARTLTYRRPRLPFVSTLTGRAAAPVDPADPTYWRRQIREPVRFAGAVSTLIAAGCNRFVEVGAHPALLVAAQDVAGGSSDCVFVATQRRDRDALEQMLASLGELFVWGVDPSWKDVYGGETRRRVALPTYPFERRGEWPGTSRTATDRVQADSGGSSMSGARPVEPAIRQRVIAARGVDRLSMLDAWVQRAFALATGQPPEHITRDRSCLELGMDSLRIVDLAARIRTAFGVPCTPADIMSQPTSTALSRLLDAALPSASGTAARPKHEHGGRAPAVVGGPSRPGSRAPRPLVVLHAGGTRCPLICVHPSGGRITSYLRLRALLGDDRPLYALQSRALADPAVEHRSIAAMAIDYASLVEGACQPPYELLGWSMGGLIAHSMAVELERRDVMVERVTMIDARAPRWSRGTDRRVFALTAWLLEMQPALSLEQVRAALSGRDLSSATPDSLLAWWENTDIIARGSATAVALDRDVRLYEHHFDVAEQFEPRPLAAPVDQWWVKPAPEDASLSSLFGTDVRRYVVRGTHFSVMQPPAIETIAAALAAPAGKDRFRPERCSR